MATPYDSYDYPSYWVDREYEDKADRLAIKRLSGLIKKKGSLIDIGGGFGRLTSSLVSKFKTILLIDHSEGLLKEARKYLSKHKNIKVKKGSCESLPVKNETFNTALMVRVVHHLKNPEKALKEAHRALKPGGFLILEFANKNHLKSVFRAFLKGKLSYVFSFTPENISTHRGVQFQNYHPTHIKNLLKTNGFKIIKTLSVSNFRLSLIKKIIPLPILLFLEAKSQSFLAYFSFGPSIFVLAQKKT